MENFNYLGVINGVYNLSADAAEFNIYSRLLIYFNEAEYLLKCVEERIIYRIDKPLIHNKNIEKIFNTGPLELHQILNNFNEKLIKENIFNRFYDDLQDYINFDYIY